MSPEANSEQGQDQATKSKFDTSVHPEGVREFGKHADLSEMARITEDDELKTNISIPEHPGTIDPHTHEVEVEKVAPLNAAPEKSPWYTKTGAKIAGAALVVTTVLAGGAAVMGGDDKATEPRDTEPTASAPASPGGEQTSQPITPEKSPGLGEIVASVEQYPTAAEAITPLFEQIDEYRNYFTGKVLTEQQLQEHDQMLARVFGPSFLTENVAPFKEGMQKEWQEIMGYKSLTKQSIDAGYGTEMFEASMTPTDILPVGEDTVRFTVDLSTNAHETGLDENMSPEVAADIESEFQARAILGQQDGGWYIKEYYVQK